MSSTQTSVSLMSLPMELLRIIVAECDAADCEDSCSLALVSRHFRALAQERIHRDVSVTYGYERFEQLARTLTDRPDLRAAVRSMSLRGVYYKPRTGSGNGRQGKNIRLAASVLRSVLRLQRCVKLDLADITPKQLEEVFRPPLFLKITTLALEVKPKLAAVTSDINCWAGLARLPSLTDLRITLSDVTIPPPAPADVFGLVTRLTLVGDFDSEFREPLFATFPNLRILRIEDVESASFIKQLLSTAPIKLASLSLVATSPRIPMEEYLDRYRHLTELDLTPGFQIKRILPVLARSRIERLSFSDDCAVSDDFLASLVDGPYQMKQLKALQLTFVTAPMGDELYYALAGEGDFDDPDGIFDNVQLFRAMVGPTWPANCTPAGLARLVARSRAVGISLSGSAVDCLDWDRDFDSQLEYHLIQLAMERDDLSVLERYYGRQGAGDALARQRPAFVQLATEAARRQEEVEDS